MLALINWILSDMIIFKKFFCQLRMMFVLLIDMLVAGDRQL
jgi:hypothetical protein